MLTWQSAPVVIVWRRRDRELRRQIGEAADQSGRDFSRARLVALDLRRKSLRGCNFEYADLTEADLTGADLRGANLHGAYLTGTVFMGANLAGARLAEAMMMATDLPTPCSRAFRWKAPSGIRRQPGHRDSFRR